MGWGFFKPHFCKFSETVRMQEVGGYWECCVRCNRAVNIILDDQYDSDAILPFEVTQWVLAAILRDTKPQGP